MAGPDALSFERPGPHMIDYGNPWPGTAGGVEAIIRSSSQANFHNATDFLGIIQRVRSSPAYT